MAYNPFDDVIENDPAYMANGGPLPRPKIGIEFPNASQTFQPQRSVIPQQRVDPTDQEIFRPFATAIARGYKLLTPEQETLDQIEKDQQLRSLATQQAFQGTEFDQYAGDFDLPSSVLQNSKAMELLDQAGFKRQSFTEGMSRVGQFLYGNQRKAFDKLKSGEQLNSEDRLSIALAPLDSLDFLLPPVAIKKLAGIGLKNINAVLKSTSDLPEVQQVKQLFGGSPVPAIGRAEGPPGMDTGPRIALAAEDGTGKGARLTKEGVKSREDNTQQLINILKQDLDENKTKSIGQIIKDNNLQGLLKTERGKGFELKKEVRQKIISEVPDIFKSKFAIRAQPAAQLKRAETDPKLTEVLEKFVKDGTTFNSPYALSQRLDALGIATRRAITKRKNDPNFKPFFDILIQPKPKKTKTTDSFDKVFRQVPETNIINILSTPNAPMVTVKDFNPRGFDLIKELRTSQGITGEFSPKELFKDFLEFRYRNVKDSGQFPDLTPEKFFNRKYDAEEVTKIREEFKNFISLEQTRLAMQKETRDFLEELSQIPEYKKYLLDSKGQLDLKLVKVDKAHDTPLFLTRVEGAGRLKNVGRFLDQGTEPEFINPSFQAYNNLQKITDPLINKLADLRVNKTLRKQAEKMDFNLSKKTKTKSGKYIVPKDRLDFVSEDMIKYLNLKGANINLDNFKNGNQLDFLNAVDKAIDKIYKDRAIRTLVPVREGKGGKKLSVFFGVEDMKAIPNEARVELFKKSLKDQLDFAVENNLDVGDFKNLNEKKGDIGFIKRLKKGGAVRMAIGGDPLENINQQQFTPDPAIDEDFFQQVVDSGNLTAFNPTKLFKVFGKVDAVETPKKKIEKDAPLGPPGTTLPLTQQMQPSDFAFKSFTLDVINDPNAPKAARPQDWMNFFKGKAAPEAELRDTGLMQFLEDYAKYYPDQKLTQQRLNDFYEQSPMGNISIKVKQEGTAVPADPEYLNFVGRPRHKNTGNQDLDNVGTDYREVIVQSGALPGETKPFVESGHFQEQNVIGFTRVADYQNTNGQKVAVIQELQTDMLTKVRKEQERIAALLKRIEKIKERAEQRIASGDPYESASGQNMLLSINNQFPTATLQKLQENLSAIKPFPNTAGLDQVPKFAEQLQNLQKQINDLINVELKSPNPQTPFALEQLENQQSIVLNNLLDLTRNTEMERELQGLKVPSTRETDELQEFAGESSTFNVNYGGFKDLELFPPVPFNKQPDYVDLLLKATIKDAQSKGIDKVAIMPAEKVNMRWGKDPDGPSGVKFKNLYDKVVPQQLKNIAKKYGGTLQVEQIVDPNKPSKGLRFFNRDVDGGLKLNKEDVARRTTTESEEGINEFYNEQIRRFVSGGGYRQKDVVFTREIAPGQNQDFYVYADDNKIDFLPLEEGESINDALIVIEEFNPQTVDMFTITLDSPKSKEPFFMFKKKDGGAIAKDSLVSVTDIFGEYGSR
jgi:hypothetical protein